MADLLTAIPKPAWLKVRAPDGENYIRLKDMMSELKLATVCQSARCPNIGECWSAGTATVMLMGDVCTRGCRFCNVKTGNPKGKIDSDEPQKVGYAIGQMNLDYVVLTSVDRDDLPDQGSAHFAETIRVIKQTNPKTLVEVLTPDFRGDRALVEGLVRAKPDVFAHNIETTEALTKKVRDPRATYRQSLDVLRMVKEIDPSMKTKSSIMLGLGEVPADVLQALEDLRSVGCDVVTFGQYLQPTGRHLKVIRYLEPAEFTEWQRVAESLGFLYVASGALVRSSYRAGEFFMKAMIEKDRKEFDFKREDWGQVRFEKAFQRQLEKLEQVRSGASISTLILCSHEPVVTMGRKTTAHDLGTWTGATAEANRGGSVTYHGPNQIIGYPIVDLALVGRDLHAYLSALENTIVAALAKFGVLARGGKEAETSATGVWVGEKKIASIGVGVRNWVTLHGFALNVEHDEQAFEGIRPCGFEASIMTSLEEVLGMKPDRERLLNEIESAFRQQMNRLARKSQTQESPHGNFVEL
jgi:lipoic acid synthetase